MKRLSMSLSAIALVLTLALSGAAFTTAPATVDNNTTSKPRYTGIHVPLVHQNWVYMYYWFWPDDTYNDYEDLQMEVWEMGQFYYPGYIADTDPSGGTLIMEGYMM